MHRRKAVGSGGLQVQFNDEIETRVYENSQSEQNTGSALEVFLNDMRYINPRFTYLLTYASTELRQPRSACSETARLSGGRTGEKRHRSALLLR